MKKEMVRMMVKATIETLKLGPAITLPYKTDDTPTTMTSNRAMAKCSTSFGLK
jgi:hypothetical protein